MHPRYVLLCAGALLALSGCATMRGHEAEAASTESRLAAAGFKMRPADTPERLRDLATMPPRRMVARKKDGNVMYTFADPQNCRCLYVGGAKEYAEYERGLEKEVARAMDESSMDWDLWIP
jgi:hypothetical protein